MSLYMTAETEHDPLPDPVAVHEPARRSGSIILVLLVAAGLVAVAVALMTLGRAHAQPYILGVLAVLAMVGLFCLFAFAAGIIRFADRTADDPVMSRIADHAYDGLAVTDPRGHVVYSNAAYLTLTGAASPQDVRPVERVFIGNPDVSEAVFRLLKAAREGKRQQEEVRIAGQRWRAGPLAADAGAAARRRQALALRGVVDRRHHPRPRTPGRRVPGTAARHRISRSCAVRLLLGQSLPATSSMSTLRWRTGSTMIWPRSALAG